VSEPLTLPGDRPAVVLVDLQRDYFADDELARCQDDLVAACTRVVDAGRAAGLPVIEVRTVHRQDRSTWALNMLDDGAGLVLEGTSGAEPVDGMPVPDEVVVKTRDSAFHGTGLAELLRERRVDGLLLCGVSTESCIAATATDAYAHDLRVVHVSDAQASVDWALHDDALALLGQQYRQRTATSHELVALLRGTAGA
jgi:nicotinamidase-related amidase